MITEIQEHNNVKPIERRNSKRLKLSHLNGGNAQTEIPSVPLAMSTPALLPAITTPQLIIRLSRIKPSDENEMSTPSNQTGNDTFVKDSLENTSNARKTKAHHDIKRIVVDNRVLYKCGLCSCTRTKKQYVINHLLTHREKPFECTLCQRRFDDKDLMDIHIKVHQTRRNRFKAQERVKISAEKKYDCYICHWESSTLFQLKQHMRCHIDQTRFRCDICSKFYTKNHNLLRHVRNAHK